MPWKLPRAAAMLSLAALATGCSSTLVTLTKRSGIEQELLVRSLERAVSQLDVDRLAGKRVALELFALTEDQAFAQHFVAALMEARGVDVVPEAGTADLRLRIFASVLGVDRGETMVGIPTFTAPLVGVPVPEIALFKWVRNRGRSEVQVFAYDARNDRLIDAIPAGVGQAKFDEFTLLLTISFTNSDLDEPAAPTGG